MALFQNIKRSFYKKALQSKTRNLQVDRVAVNFNKAETFGILFVATQPENIVVVSNFANKLRKMYKRVELFGYVDGKMQLDNTFRWINKKDITWYYKPKGYRSNSFIFKEFDVLINAYMDECLPLEFIATLSRAKFRMGPFNDSKTQCSDFMIQLPENPNLEAFFKQIEHYLKVINKHE